jgi:hypothetical protein
MDCPRQIVTNPAIIELALSRLELPKKLEFRVGNWITILMCSAPIPFSQQFSDFLNLLKDKLFAANCIKRGQIEFIKNIHGQT